MSKNQENESEGVRAHSNADQHCAEYANSMKIEASATNASPVSSSMLEEHPVEASAIDSHVIDSPPIDSAPSEAPRLDATIDTPTAVDTEGEASEHANERGSSTMDQVNDAARRRATSRKKRQGKKGLAGKRTAHAGGHMNLDAAHVERLLARVPHLVSIERFGMQPVAILMACIKKNGLPKGVDPKAWEEARAAVGSAGRKKRDYVGKQYWDHRPHEAQEIVNTLGEDAPLETLQLPYEEVATVLFRLLNAHVIKEDDVEDLWARAFRREAGLLEELRKRREDAESAGELKRKGGRKKKELDEDAARRHLEAIKLFLKTNKPSSKFSAELHDVANGATAGAAATEVIDVTGPAQREFSRPAQQLDLDADGTAAPDASGTALSEAGASELASEGPSNAGCAFELGELVEHETLGGGRVSKIVDNRKVSIEFHDGVTRTIVCDYLRTADAAAVKHQPVSMAPGSRERRTESDRARDEELVLTALPYDRKKKKRIDEIADLLPELARPTIRSALDALIARGEVEPVGQTVARGYWRVAKPFEKGGSRSEAV